MIRCRGRLLRNRGDVQGESATKGYVLDINLSQDFKQSGRNANVRKQEKEVVVSVVLIIVGRGEVTAGPHGTAAVGSKLKTLCAFPLGRYLHPEARCMSRKLGVTMVTVGHVTAAVSCCLEMALWSTLWMADQVSMMASGGVIGISHEVANEFPGMWARRTCGLEDERNEVDVWISVKFVLFRSFGHESWFCAGCRDHGRIAREGSNNGHIQIHDRTVRVKDKSHPSVFSLSVDNTGESRYLLFNAYLCATV